MQNKKVIESEFIVKIIEIMKDHPQVLNWTPDGTELHLSDIDIFCQKVLPAYFRHSNFNSFIRQLNIYSFNKTKKVGRSMWFKHDIFKRGNDNNFFLVQRKRKFKELENYQERFEKQCEDLIAQVRNKRQITSQVKEIIINLLEFKYVSHVNLKRMKCELDALHKDIKDSRNTKVHDIATELKTDLLSSIRQLTSESKKIDEFISKSFLRMKDSSQTKEVPDLNQNEILFSRHIQQAYGLSHSYSKSRSVTKEEPQEKYVIDEVKDNFRSYNSFNVFLEQCKTRKEQFAYDHKLFNPFHSQNSFMFLPNYITGPSHMPFDGKYNVQYQSVINENHESSEKNQAFNHFEESASISFVKDYGEEENQVFAQRN